MNALTPNREHNILKWTQIIKECRASGQTVDSWCAQNGVHIKSYYYWLAKFRKQAAAEISATEVPDPAPAKPVFAEVSVQGIQTSASAEAIRITTRHASIELPSDISMEALRIVIEAVIRC